MTARPVASGMVPVRNPRFRQTRPQALDSGEPIPSEWDLHCGACGYNLTGLTARRCPECGERFKPQELWAASRLAAAEARGERVPLYVSYGLVGLFLAAILRMAFARPYILLPFFLFPAYELLSRHRGRNRTKARLIVLALCGVLALAIRFTW